MLQPSANVVPCVRQYRQSLLWPLRLVPPRGQEEAGAALRRPWQVITASLAAGAVNPWQAVANGFSPSGQDFQERHYHEFVTFLPFVQRFLFGEVDAHGQPDAAMQVLRRQDVAAVRVVLHPDAAPITLQVHQVALYFFFDVGQVLLHVELAGAELSLPQAQELLYRLGRGYPSGWDASGRAMHSPVSMAWLDAQGQVLVASDAQARERFLTHVGGQRAPRIAADWAWLLQPLIPDGLPAADDPGHAWRFRQIEYYRMPVMAWLALDDPGALSRADFVRLGLVTGAPAQGAQLPYAEAHLADFEARYCYDRFWADEGPAPRTRYLMCGHALVVVGDARSAFFTCGQHGVLAQFRHEHFLLFLIAHFQKAALLMVADRLAQALKALDVGDADSVRRFKRHIRAAFEGFLRFTHRYWFRDVAEQAQARAIFQMTSQHLGTERLYGEVKERIRDMSDYLDADSIRRQANTVVRLTVVTILGMIGTTTTGFLGMNLLDEASSSPERRVLFFLGVAVLSTLLTFYTITKSKRLSDFLDALSDERLSFWQKLGVLFGVWR